MARLALMLLLAVAACDSPNAPCEDFVAKPLWPCSYTAGGVPRGPRHLEVRDHVAVCVCNWDGGR